MSAPRRAFTLIELTVVIAIIGILAAILVPVFVQPYIAERRSEAQREMGAIEEAVLGHPESGEPGYLSTVGALPGSVTDLLVKPNAVNAPPVAGGVPQFTAGNMVVGWVGPYLRVGTQNPVNDPWGSPYTFVTAPALGGAQLNWRIHSDGPDRTANTGDDLDYPGAATGGNPGAPYPSAVTSLLVRVVRMAGPAWSTVPAGTQVDLTIANTTGGVLPTTPNVTRANTDANGWAQFASTAAARIPLGRIGVTVSADGTTYDRVIIARRAMTVATVTIPMVGSKFVTLLRCAVPDSTWSFSTAPGARNTKTCTPGFPATYAVTQGQVYEVTLNGALSSSIAGQPCFAAVSWNNDTVPAAVDLSVPGAAPYLPIAVNSALPSAISITRTIQATATVPVIAPAVTLQSTGAAACTLTGGTLFLRTWTP